jgi:hypothetical protein
MGEAEGTDQSLLEALAAQPLEGRVFGHPFAAIRKLKAPQKQ